MTIVVLGAGAIGSAYGYQLAADHDVTLVGTAAHVQAIRDHGLRIEGSIRSGTYPVKAVTSLEAIAPGTLIILTTKVSSTVEAVTPIVPLLSPSVIILCVQNGLYSERLVLDLVGDRAVTLRAITQVGAILRGPGVVEHTVQGYTLVEAHERAAGIAEVLTASGLDGRVIPDMKTAMWRKIVFNCVINPITAITGSTVGGIVDPKLAPIKRLVIDECLAVAAADGVTFDEDFMATIDKVFASAATLASTLQDLQKGRRTEIDHLNGAVVALGERYGIPCPVNAALTTIIKQLEAQARLA
ncbi:MAG: ketopantoate reductase family protein [Acidobacteriota bacterium]|nr:ketopantoate reductase family protein [Acidobacteriota bacterium]